MYCINVQNIQKSFIIQIADIVRHNLTRKYFPRTSVCNFFVPCEEVKPVDPSCNYRILAIKISQISCSIHAAWEHFLSVDRYIEREFPEAEGGGNAVYSVPSVFQKSGGEKQANLAEQLVFTRLHGLLQAEAINGLWITFFHSASYAGRSFRNQRLGKLMIREHDFVIFAKHDGTYNN